MAKDVDVGVRVGANIDSLRKELTKGEKLLKNFRTGVNSGAKSLAGIGAAATGAGVAIAVGLVKNSLEAIDAQAKLAKKLSTSTTELETLTRAGNLSGVSLKEITNAAVKLEINAGKASQGLLTQKRAFDAMGLSAKEVLKLPLAERLNVVNTAIRNNVAETEQAATAADLFGAKSAVAIKLLSPENIQRAAEETELFGTALSNIDAAKVENANDAMGSFELAAQGVSKQLTVKLSPILQKLAEDFKDSSKEAGGIGDAVGDGVNTAIDALGFVLDALHGVKTAFLVVEESLISGFSAIFAGILAGVSKVSEMLDKITPGDRFGKIADETSALMDSMVSNVAAAKDKIDAHLMAPIPSDGLKQFVKEAEKAGKAAAEATAKATEDAQAKKEVDDKTSAEKLAEEKAAKLAAKEKEARDKKIKVIQDSLKTEEELAQQKFNSDMAIFAAKLEKEGELTAENQATIQERAAQHAEKMKQFEDDKFQAGTDAAKKGLSTVSSLMDSENKKQFKVAKAASVAQTVMDTYSAAQGAYASLASIPYVGPALGIAAAAAAIASGNARISAIKSQSFSGGGSARSGGGSAPAPAAGGAAAAPEAARNINISGVNPSDFVQVGGLVEQINNELGDGANLNINFAGA